MGLRIVQERRRGDVDQVDVIAGQELVDVFDVGNAEPPRGGQGRLSMRSRHSGQLHARHLGKLLKGVEPKTPAADHAEPDFSRIHGHSVLGCSFVLTFSKQLIGTLNPTQLAVSLCDCPPSCSAGQFTVAEDGSSSSPEFR